jgi:oxygen-independent coproporphyrinogen-3 oxidase
MKKCPYCAFNSSMFTENEEKRYVQALIKEMELLKKNEDINGWEFESLYMGGGTPTSLKTENIIRIFEKAFSVFCRDTASMEVTMEGNPESATLEKLMAVKDCGCNRLSLGFQDLSSKGLKALGRSHTVKQSLNAYEAARKAGFGNISIDLIYGWPGQTKDEWKKTLRFLTSFSPDSSS